MRTIACLLLASLLVQPLLLWANSTEVTFAPVPVISPWTFWCPTPSNCAPEKGRFFNPSGVKNGNEFLMYVQGGVYNQANGGPGAECSLGEEVLLFKAPWTAAGLRSAFTYVKPVTPCNTAVPGVHYSLDSVFRSSTDGAIKLLVTQTENGAEFAEGDFKRVLLGSSPDGANNWTWSTFLKQSTVSGALISVFEATLVQATANSNWWGLFIWGTSLNDKVGRIRVLMDPQNPRGYVAYILAQDQTWQAVADDGSFNFQPANVWPGLPQPNGIVHNNASWETI